MDFLAWAFGGVEKAARVFVANELEPLQATLLEINERVNEMIVRFRPYVLEPVNPTPVKVAQRDHAFVQNAKYFYLLPMHHVINDMADIGKAQHIRSNIRSRLTH